MSYRHVTQVKVMGKVAPYRAIKLKAFGKLTAAWQTERSRTTFTDCTYREAVTQVLCGTNIYDRSWTQM